MESGLVSLMVVVSRYRWTALALAFGGQLCNSLSAQSVAPLAPLFQPELGLTKAEVGVFTSAAFFGAWGVLLIAGWLSDTLGVRRVMSAGALIAGTFLLAMTAARSFPEALAVMFLVGLGRGVVLPGTTKAVMEWFPPTSRATAMGVKLAGMPVGGILTASLLPTIALTFGWRSAIAVVGLLIIALGVASALLYRDAGRVKAASKAAAKDRPRLSEVLKDRRLWGLIAVSLLYVTIQAATPAHLPLYFKEVVLAGTVPEENLRIVAAGGFLALYQTGGTLGRVLSGVVSDRLLGGRRTVLLAAMGIPMAGGSLLLGYAAPVAPSWFLAPLVFLYGVIAVGWASLLHAAVCEVKGSALAASATGFSNTLSQLGLVGGPPLFGMLVDATGSYGTGWLFLAGLAAAGSIVGFWCVRRENGAAS